MSSDADYAAFLEKANQDTGASNMTSQSTRSKGSKVVDTEVPANLQSIDVIYESEADEPFEPVSLKWNKEELPTQSMFIQALLQANIGVATNQTCTTQRS